jgi:protein SCO1/2
MRHCAIVLALLAAACGDYPDRSALEHDTPEATVDAADLKILGDVPEFTFLERSGKPLEKKSLKGRVWIAAFIFTRCTTICIPMCGEMRALQDDFEEEKDFAIVATTVDPAYDTPAVLTEFAKIQGARRDRWYFLTGKHDDIKAFEYEGLKVPGDPENIRMHSNYFVLIDRQGKIRGYYQQSDAERMDKLRLDIKALLVEKAP